VESATSTSVRLITHRSIELKPGEKRKIGWLRFSAAEPILSVKKI
jgi:hypothetical protein